MDPRCSILTPIRLWRERLSPRLAIAVLGMSLLSALLLIGNEFRDSARALDAQIDAIGITLANTVASNCADLIITEDQPAVEDFAKHLLRQTDVLIAQVRIERADGKVLNLDSQAAGARAKGEIRRFTAPVLLQPEGRLLGRCSIGLVVEPWRAQLRARTTAALAQNLVAFALITTVLTLLLRSWLGRPLRDLDEAAQRIAAGNLTASVPATGVGELRRLALTLEGMRCSLQESHASLQEQNTRLREVDRLKDEFLANTSHEIRTPLHMILGGLEMLADATGAEREELLDAMNRNGRHLLFLINQVLDFSKLQAGNLHVQPQGVALQPLLADVLACVRPEARDKGLDCQLRLCTDPPAAVHADPLRLRQILINLLGNAVKFTAKGAVRLRVSRVRGYADQLLRIVVTDSGPGIRDAVRQRLFTPFVQGDASLTRQFGGTGLGLVISRQLARTMGGDLTLNSKVGRGTRVVLTLPIGRVAAAAAPVEPTSPLPALPRKRVLLVDDAPDNRRLLSTMLRKAGMEVATAADGAQGCDAVQQAAASGDPFDLVLMDIQMPVLDGHQAARRLRANGCRLPLIALTAHATEQDRRACLAAGFDDYATKPIGRTQLTQLVDRHLRPQG